MAARRRPRRHLRALRTRAKRLTTNQDLAVDLWRSGGTAARLLSLLICRPRAFGREILDQMLRGARTPKVQTWLVNYVVNEEPARAGPAPDLAGRSRSPRGQRRRVPGSTSPYAPVWIAEMVRRREG